MVFAQGSNGWLDYTPPSDFSPLRAQRDDTRLIRDRWATSTPDERDCEPVNFDGGRVRAWLQVQTPVLPEGRTCCSKAVQTDGEVSVCIFPVNISMKKNNRIVLFFFTLKQYFDKLKFNIIIFIEHEQILTSVTG